MNFNERYSKDADYSFPVDSFKKYLMKTDPNVCIFMYFKNQSDLPRTTRNALKKSNFQFIYSIIVRIKIKFGLETHYYASFITSRM